MKVGLYALPIFKSQAGPDFIFYGVFTMRVRSVLLSTVVALSSLGPSYAFAAQILNPQGNWAVTKVEAKQPGSAPYCALARRFGNGSIITFARNSANETSVAVDFPPGSFKPSQNYTIVLDPGSNESRSYKTQPVSERGIVIRMGRDDKFYNALEQNGKLGIAVEDKSYSFTMSDMKSGTQDLSACLGTSIEPAAGSPAGEAKEASEAAPVSKTQKMAEAVLPTRTPPVPGSSAIPASDSDIQSLKEENIRLRNALERERRTYEDKMQHGDSSSASAELSEKLQLLQTENVQLKDKLNTLKPGAAAINTAAPAVSAALGNCTPTRVDDARFEGLKAENTRLKAEIDAQAQHLPSKADDTGTSALRAENTQLKADLSSEKQKVASLELAQKTFVDNKGHRPVNQANDVLITSMKSQISKLESENSALKLATVGKSVQVATSNDDMKGNAASVAKIQGLEEELSQLKADRDRLATQMDAFKMTPASGPNAKISSENWNLEQATLRYNEAEHEIQRLGSVVEQERAKCIVEKKNIEYMLFDPKIATKQQIAKLGDLESQLNEAKKTAVNADKVAAADKAAQDLKQQLASANDQIAQMKKSLDDSNRQKLAANDQTSLVGTMKQEIASLNNQIANMQMEKSSLPEKLARINTSSGGDTAAARLAARPETVIPNPAVEMNAEGLNRSASAKPASVLPPVDAKPPTPDIGRITSAIAPVVPAQTVTPMTATPVQSIVSETQPSGGKLMSLTDITTLLAQSGVKTTGTVTPVAASTNSGRVTYKWKTEGLFGTAEQKILDNPTQYDKFVQEYLDKTKSHCQGQFAAVPGMVNINGGNRMSVYEIACVNEKSGDGESAALVFYSLNGTFTTIAHEASSDTMDVAMDARDKVIATLDNNAKTAAR